MSRVVGVDVARCLALVGMMATHILPATVDGELTLAHQVAGGRASALFAVLAGLSLVLIAGERRPLRGAGLVAMAAGTVVRALLVGVVGLVLGGLDTGIAVILCSYAVLFVVAVPFLALGSRALAVTAAGWAVAGPVVSLLLRRDLPPPSYDVPAFASLGSPGELLRELLVTGYYPVLTWVPYLLLGMVLGRLDLRSARTAVRLLVGGAWAAAFAWWLSATLTSSTDVRRELVVTFEGAGWRGDLTTTLAHGLYGVTPTGSPWWLAVAAPHSGTPLDLLMTAGSACAVLGACLLVALGAGSLLGRPGTWLLGVAGGAGTMTLTLYSLHVVLRTEGVWDSDDTATLVGQVLLVLAVGAAFRAAGWRGPLERLTGDASRWVRASIGSRHEPHPSL